MSVPLHAGKKADEKPGGHVGRERRDRELFEGGEEPRKAEAQRAAQKAAEAARKNLCHEACPSYGKAGAPSRADRRLNVDFYEENSISA